MKVMPFPRGFFCNDESLHYPYHDDTITMVGCAILGVIPLVFMLVAFEVYRSWRYYNKEESKFNQLLEFMKNVAIEIGIGSFGGAICYITTEILKVAVGRLRPHFFDVCKPDFASFNCSIGYITDFTCTATDTDRLQDAKKSFPSGHSSFIAYCIAYIIVYLQVRLPRQKCRMLRSLVQFGAVLIALYVCASRISDYKHHWSDVLAGALLGIITSSLTVLYISDLFHNKRKEVENENESDESKTTEKKAAYRMKDTGHSQDVPIEQDS